MFVIVTCEHCGEICEPEIQWIDVETFNDPLTRPFEYLAFEACDVYGY